MYRNTIIITGLLIFFSISVVNVHSQDATPVKPGNYTGPVNYVRVWDVQVPITDATTVTNRSLREVKMSTQYFDGLGRPVEAVTRQGSLITGSSAVDLVTAQTYDEFGREIRKYLPFASNGSGATNNGSFKTDPFDQQVNFYSDINANSPIKAQGETFYYSKTELEPSPLNRVDRNYAAGNNWVGGSGNGVKIKYWINTDNDAVRIWNVQDVANDFGTYSTPATNGVYAAGQLYKNVTEDEKGKQVIEFKDKEGKVILKKVQLLDYVNGVAVKDDGTGRGYDGWLSTYYIYDDFGQLRCVIQPEGVKSLATSPFNWDLTYNSSILLSEQCFRYGYDGRGRMVMKKVPGAGVVYMIYDARDRLVMTQDANLRNAQPYQKFLFTQYDDLNRPVRTGTISTTGDWIVHRDYAANSTSYPWVEGYANEIFTETHYNDYTGLPSGLSALFNGSGYSTYLNASSGSSEFADAVPTSPSSLTKGAVTWMKVKVLGTASQYITTVNLYDDKGRVVQTQSINVTGGLDVVTTQYNFTGQVVRNHVKHQKLTGTAQTYEIATKNSYDDLGRITLIEKAIGGSTTYNQISSLAYNALGQLKTKKLAPSFNSNAGLETQNYDYNIRGWLLGINRTDLANNGSSQSKFAFDLGYDKLNNGSGRNYTASQLNGNIAGMVWKSAGDGVRRKYDFSYDNTNRLIRGLFEQNNSGSTWNNTDVNYTVKMGDGSDATVAYDYNGNIKQMQQWGWKLTGSALIDNLSYSYFANSNKLSSVTDLTGTTDNKLGDFTDKNTQGNDYGYDQNGNMVTDLNKKITGTTGIDLTSGGAISYNYLNLPQTIAVKNDIGTDKGSIEYVYDATGNKLKKIVHETNKPDKTTLYLFGTYEDDVLQFLPQEEGRIRLRTTDNSYQYDYFIKDHLGNVRMVLTEEQRPDGYPAATMETAQSANENLLYTNINNTRYPKSSISGYPADNYTSPNDYVAKTNGSGNKIGPAIILKVMAGDKFNIRVTSWYKTNGSSPGTPVSPLNDLIYALTGSVAAVNGGKASAAELINSGSGWTAASSFLNAQSYNSTRPKAFVNWILLDDQFKIAKDAGGNIMASGYCGADQVGSDQEFKTHIFNGMPINKSGYLYVYVSNETPNIDVFFDNLQVTHVRGPILEETHYYPFGLTMQGISSSTIPNGTPNRKKFNGIEENRDLDLNQYDAFYRTLDPQIGRFLQVDPKIESAEAWSPYSAMLDNPIRYMDPLGDSTVPGAGFWSNVGNGIADGWESTKGFVKSLGTVQGWKNVATGLNNINPLGVMTPEKLQSQAQTGEAVVNGVKNIPNMTKDDWGHAVGFGLEKTAEIVVLSKGTSVVGNAVKGATSTTLFRAASSAEIADATANGVRNTATGYQSGKLFATSASDAAQYGKNNFGLDGVPNTIMKVKVPNSVMKTAYVGEMDGMKAVSIPESQLPKVKFISPFNYTPKPSNPFGNTGW